jgi:hypothetical protein
MKKKQFNNWNELIRYFDNNYQDNSYLFHGSSSIFNNSIEQYGFDPSYLPYNLQEIKNFLLNFKKILPTLFNYYYSKKESFLRKLCKYTVRDFDKSFQYKPFYFTKSIDSVILYSNNKGGETLSCLYGLYNKIISFFDEIDKSNLILKPNSYEKIKESINFKEKIIMKKEELKREIEKHYPVIYVVKEDEWLNVNSTISGDTETKYYSNQIITPEFIIFRAEKIHQANLYY